MSICLRAEIVFEVLDIFKICMLSVSYTCWDVGLGQGVEHIR
jgi:hypothetical protein